MINLNNTKFVISKIIANFEIIFLSPNQIYWKPPILFLLFVSKFVVLYYLKWTRKFCMRPLSLEFSLSMLPLVSWILFIDMVALRTLTNLGQINLRRKLYKQGQLMFCKGSGSSFCFVQHCQYRAAPGKPLMKISRVIR